MEVLRQKALVLSRIRSIAKVVIALSSVFALVGCGGFAEWIAVRLFYREAILARAPGVQGSELLGRFISGRAQASFGRLCPRGHRLASLDLRSWRRLAEGRQSTEVRTRRPVRQHWAFLRYSGDRRGARQLPFAAGCHLARPGQGCCSGVGVGLWACGKLRCRQARHFYFWPFVRCAAGYSDRPGSRIAPRITPAFPRPLRRDCGEWCTFRHLG